MTVHKTINIKGTLLDLATPKVMGIINVTPDSFYKGSRQQHLDEILASANRMLEEGATFLDIGGYSSRPGAKDISIQEEMDRVIRPIELIAKNFPQAIISIDTFRSEVARTAIQSGAHIVNDISAGLLDDQMLDTIGELSVPYIAMHMKGTPQNMKEKAEYDDLTKDIAFYFSERIAAAKAAGVKDLILDPGFGFAKTVEHNFRLLNQLEYLSNLGFPMLVGVSRKSMIYRSLNIDPEDALNGTTVLNTVALQKGAAILRVHDVKEAVQAVELINLLKS